MAEVVKRVKPTVLVGVSTQKEAFTEEVSSFTSPSRAELTPLGVRRQIIREMAKNCDHPIVFPLSNPTKLTEVTPENVEKWTEGKGHCAAGSPFDPVSCPAPKERENRAHLPPSQIKKGDKEYPVGEANNA